MIPLRIHLRRNCLRECWLTPFKGETNKTAAKYFAKWLLARELWWHSIRRKSNSLATRPWPENWKGSFDKLRSRAVIFCSAASTIRISEFLPFIRRGRNGRGCILKTNHLWKQRSSCNYSYWNHWRPISWAWLLPGGRKIHWETNYGEYLDRLIEIIYVLNND